MNSHTTTSDYACLDRPEVLAFLFHPRPEPGALGAPAPEAQARTPGTSDVLIPVADAAVVGARLHLADPAAPSILFFHGNGEIVADYDDHNSIFMAGLGAYLAAIREMVFSAGGRHSG
jgi:hypothetical protein